MTSTCHILMCNSSGSSWPLLRAPTLQHCCDPKKQGCSFPTILSTRAVAHRPLRHSHAAQEQLQTLTLLGKKTGLPADFAFLPRQITHHARDSSSAEHHSQRMLNLRLLLLRCHVPSGAAHTHMHGSALPLPSQGMISYLCQTHTHHGESKQWCQKQEEWEVTAVTAKTSLFLFL